MKILKILTASFLSLVLVGCGGHGYEGEYKAKVKASDLMGGLGGLLGGNKTSETTMILGKNFIQFDEDKYEMERIEVLEEDGNKFLKLVAEGEEMYIDIEENPRTLAVSTPFGLIYYTEV